MEKHFPKAKSFLQFAEQFEFEFWKNTTQMFWKFLKSLMLEWPHFTPVNGLNHDCSNTATFPRNN